MNRLVEIIVMALGGMSLFTLCFLGFAVMADVPLDGIPVAGKLFEQPQSVTPPIEEVAALAPPDKKVPDQQVIQGALGVISTWTIDSPFTREELQHLADDLRLKKLELEDRLRKVVERERDAEELSETARMRLKDLEELRRELEAFEARLVLREQEVAAAEKIASDEVDRRWSDLGKVFARVDDPTEAAKKLAEFEAPEAARILRSLDESKAAEILNALDAALFKDYAEAYRDLGASGQ
jgi:flagellar motility protein MotE (MotC chaperone)